MLILFDALDARIHEEEAKKKDLLYLEYARIRLDGRTECGDARKTETRMLPADDQTADIQGKISENGRADGAGYREFLLLRLDGENWESDTHAENEVHIDHTRSFPGWNIWKEKNKEGMDCTVRIRREGNRVMMETENLGIAVDSVTTVKDDVRNMYIALTGDQCALTEIRIDQNTGT